MSRQYTAAAIAIALHQPLQRIQHSLFGIAGALQQCHGMDVGNSNDWTSAKLVSKKEIIEKIHSRYALREIGRDQGSAPSVDYEFADGRGDIGVIASVTEPFCGSCTRLRLTADGKIVTCLFSQLGHGDKLPDRSGSRDRWPCNQGWFGRYQVQARGSRRGWLHGGERIFPELPRSLAELAQRLLSKRGVEIRLRTRLAGATAEAALLEGGDRIATRTLVSTVSSVPNSLVASLPVKKERGRIVVDSHLAVPDYPGVWAVGDCAFVVDGGSGEPCPPTAQHAIRQARRLAENFVATLRGAPKKRFAFAALGKMASLGHRSAVGEIFGLRVSGFFAWWLWRTMYLMKLPGLDRKIRVATDWTLDLILPPDIVQLSTEKHLAIRREHFEPNETIFREGDSGDSLYIIVDGEVEITRDVPGRGDVRLARLGHGECFGEMGLVRQMPRSATVRTVTRVNVLAMDRYMFQALFAHMPPLRLFFEQLIQLRSN